MGRKSSLGGMGSTCPGVASTTSISPAYDGTIAGCHDMHMISMALTCLAMPKALSSFKGDSKMTSKSPMNHGVHSLGHCLAAFLTSSKSATLEGEIYDPTMKNRLDPVTSWKQITLDLKDLISYTPKGTLSLQNSATPPCQALVALVTKTLYSSNRRV